MRDGVPINEVVCDDSRILMVSPSGMPVCIFVKSTDALGQRGFALPDGDVVRNHHPSAATAVLDGK